MNNEFDFQSNLTATEKKNKNGYAIASLVLGIVSILSCCCCCSSGLGLIFMGVSAILAIVFAFVSKKNNDGKMDAKAIAGLVLGIVAVVVLLCFAVAIVGTYALIDQMPQEEMLTFVEENFKPMLEGNEEAYNAFVESIKAIYGTKNAQ
jgi:flagellar biosynthesis protein FlhB